MQYEEEDLYLSFQDESEMQWQWLLLIVLPSLSYSLVSQVGLPLLI
jgi:hypothetical protein